jgi:hypothetical protein
MTIILLGNNHFLIGKVGGGGWDFHCACNFLFSEPSSVKIFFSLEDSKQLFSFHVEQKYIFP